MPAGGRVAVLAPNSHVMLEAHYGVPLARAVLVALNLRLSAGELGYILDHSGAGVLICDDALSALAREALAASAGNATLITESEYERLLESSPEAWGAVEDERGLLAINYTSGTTGRPKGVMYHHRGAYLQALAMAFHARLRPRERVPVDAADVPLQRLVLHVGGDRGRRASRVPATSGP